MTHTAAFYFGNLGADIIRAARATDAAYEANMQRVLRTLGLLRAHNRPEAYEEGLLLMRAIEYAREGQTQDVLERNVSNLIAPMVSRLLKQS